MPKELPPMTGPCPHCGEAITSPGGEDAAAPRVVSAQVEVPAVVQPVAVLEARKPVLPPPLPPSARSPFADVKPVEEKPIRLTPSARIASAALAKMVAAPHPTEGLPV